MSHMVDTRYSERKEIGQSYEKLTERRFCHVWRKGSQGNMEGDQGTERGLSEHPDGKMVDAPPASVSVSLAYHTQETCSIITWVISFQVIQGESSTLTCSSAFDLLTLLAIISYLTSVGSDFDSEPSKNCNVQEKTASTTRQPRIARAAEAKLPMASLCESACETLASGLL